jgi:hypothetical protein
LVLAKSIDTVSELPPNSSQRLFAVEIGGAGQYHRHSALLSACCQIEFRRANHDAARSQ